ncbi:MAG: sigma-70 family RNA polymerase sigma factor [Phycisphaeraceae bacterium]|nr:sigma-70 family RNA polymerase sigma factor [Phycisphaeraceae bacterium]
MKDTDTTELVARAGSGDQDAWRRLVDAYTPRVFGLVFSQCRDRELAEEITQDTFVKLVTALEGYDEKNRFDSWLFRIAMNRLRDEMRRRKRHARPMDMSDGAQRAEAGSAWAAARENIVDYGSGVKENESPLEKLDREERKQRLHLALNQMKEADREILHLRHTAGMTFPEIAETLDEPLGTVLARGHRALKKLKQTLAQDPSWASD